MASSVPPSRLVIIFQSQRDCALQPRVATRSAVARRRRRNELPWEELDRDPQPQRPTELSVPRLRSVAMIPNPPGSLRGLGGLLRRTRNLCLGSLIEAVLV